MPAPENYQIDTELIPVLAEIFEQFPEGMNGPSSIEERRRLITGYLSQFPKNQNVERIDFSVKNSLDDLWVPIRIYRPKLKEVGTGLVFTIHGGGMVMGGIEEDDGNASWLAEELATTVIAINYQLAPENPFPAALNDCFEVARWILESPEQLQLLLDKNSEIDISRAIIYGGSAGGNLALATAIKLLHGGHKNFQLICAPYPMLDFKNSTPSSHEIIDLGIWDRQANIEAWRWYLGDIEDPTLASPASATALASPAYATDLFGLPPVFLDVGSCDLFRDEVNDFVKKLSDAKVPVEFHLYPGAFHASELFAPQARLSKKIWAHRFAAISKIIDKNPRSANFWLE
jgi:acetyl esterase/lipase